MCWCRAVFAILIYVSAIGIAYSQETQKDNSKKVDLGKNEFELNCAICHGLQGHGDGPYAGILKGSVPDLTVLSQQNAGIFPFQRVYDIVDGSETIGAHGTRQMPIWGQTYRLKAEENFFTWRAFPWDAEPFVRARILAVTEYVARLQIKNQEQAK
jgi:mono/diheme cytochrome c family protein